MLSTRIITEAAARGITVRCTTSLVYTFVVARGSQAKLHQTSAYLAPMRNDFDLIEMSGPLLCLRYPRFNQGNEYFRFSLYC